MNNKKGKQTKNINDERNHAIFSVCHRRFCFTHIWFLQQCFFEREFADNASFHIELLKYNPPRGMSGVKWLVEGGV